MTTSTPIGTDQLRQLISDEIADLKAIRHDLHAHPELAYEETRTSGVVREQLASIGVEFVGDLAGGTGVLGHLPGAGDDVTALRADMDALPILEETGLEYASATPGRMHACGHDGHTTMLLGTARVLARIGKTTTLPRPVSLVFQPAEEGGAGGRRMVEDGCLNGSVIGPPVTHMFGLHGWPHQDLGKVSTRPGPMLAAADMFHIIIHGTGCHAAFPHVGNDPIVAAAAVVMSIQQIAARNVNPLDSIVVSTTVLEGGTAHNIIPDAVRLRGTVRTLLPETQELAIRKLTEIAQGVASAHGCTATIEYQRGYPVTCNDPTAVDIFNSVARDGLGDDRVEFMENPVMGGEDFSFYCKEVPSCFFTLGLRRKGETVYPDLHQPTFDFNDDALATGVEMFCRLALR